MCKLFTPSWTKMSQESARLNLHALHNLCDEYDSKIRAHIAPISMSPREETSRDYTNRLQVCILAILNTLNEMHQKRVSIHRRTEGVCKHEEEEEEEEN